MTLSALIPIADGSEEIELTTITNILRRADIQVTLTSVGPSTTIKGSRGITLVADETIEQSKLKTFDLIALPGGLPGSEHLRDCRELIGMLQEQNNKGRFYAAICAAPAVVLEPHGLLHKKKACCYPCFSLNKEHRHEDPSARVVVSYNLITSQGPATAMEFALKLVECLKGEEDAMKIAKGLLFSKL